MTITLLRRVTSTRYIFLLSALAFILWSLATSLAPKSSVLSALFQMDLDQSIAKTMITQHSTSATNASLSEVTMPNTLKIRPQLGIGMAHTHLYVISLADRQDRREQMEFLRTIQDLTWTVIDAVPGNATLVNRILDWVALHRTESKKIDTLGFRWPEEINALSVSHESLKQSGSDTWAETLPSSKPKSGKSGPSTYSSLPCAIEDDSIPTFTNGTPEWMVLSPAKVACWHSHISAIRRFVEGQDSHDRRRRDNVAVILEDDIDMEKDISARLSQVWTFLPAGWDIVFLGKYGDIFTPILCNTSEPLRSELFHDLSRSLLVRRILLPVAYGIQGYKPSSITLPEMHARIRTLALRSPAAPAAPTLSALCVFSGSRPGICMAHPEWSSKELLHRSESHCAKEERK
jgi:GR25 family glycosyltransferase involved in LPS biosynthesis